MKHAFTIMSSLLPSMDLFSTYLHSLAIIIVNQSYVEIYCHKVIILLEHAPDVNALLLLRVIYPLILSAFTVDYTSYNGVDHKIV